MTRPATPANGARRAGRQSPHDVETDTLAAVAGIASLYGGAAP
jgi:hypothetical protein